MNLTHICILNLVILRSDVSSSVLEFFFKLDIIQIIFFIQFLNCFWFRGKDVKTAKCKIENCKPLFYIVQVIGDFVDRKWHRDITSTFTIHSCHSAVAKPHEAQPSTVTVLPQPPFPVRNQCIPLCAAGHSRKCLLQSWPVSHLSFLLESASILWLFSLIFGLCL